MTKFGMVTQMERNMFLGVSHIRIRRGRGPASSKLWDLLYALHTVWETATKFCTVIKLEIEENIYREKYLQGLRRMVTRDI